MRVRPGRRADLDRLRTIRSAALDEPWIGLLEAALGEESLVHVAEADRAIGYAVALTAADHSYVPELAVAPAHQGESHGSRLLEALCARLAADGIDRVRLTARADDDRVRDFYEARDFVAVDRIPGHFDGDDGVVYERRLSEPI